MWNLVIKDILLQKRSLGFTLFFLILIFYVFSSNQSISGSMYVVGAIGLYRLPDFFTRLHAPTKATTLGVGGIIIASAIFFSAQREGLSLHELLIALFLFITAPVNSERGFAAGCASSSGAF